MAKIAHPVKRWVPHLDKHIYYTEEADAYIKAQATYIDQLKEQLNQYHNPEKGATQCPHVNQ